MLSDQRNVGRSMWMTGPVLVAVILVAILVIAFVPRDRESLVLATTTSTYDSGLLDILVPRFEDISGIDVKVIAVGTGQALRLGEAGDADVLLVHAPDLETVFVEDGHGLYRRQVMYNSFLLVGPPSDPAGISGLPDAKEAMERIYGNGTTFCSRGDDSGTHARERDLWAEAGLDYGVISSHESSDWYLSLGQGMGDTLRLASDVEGYTLTDEGTFYAMRAELDLEVMVEDDQSLRNQYSVIPVNGKLHEGVNQRAAEIFADWLVSDESQALIDGYTVDMRALFIANGREDRD